MNNYKKISLARFLIGNIVDISEEFNLELSNDMLTCLKEGIKQIIDRYPKLEEKNFVDILSRYRNNLYKSDLVREDLDLIDVFINSVIYLRGEEDVLYEV